MRWECHPLKREMGNAFLTIVLIVILHFPLLGSVLLPPSTTPFLCCLFVLFSSSSFSFSLFLLQIYKYLTSLFHPAPLVLCHASSWSPTSSVPWGRSPLRTLATAYMGSPSLSRWHSWTVSKEYKTETNRDVVFQIRETSEHSPMEMKNDNCQTGRLPSKAFHGTASICHFKPVALRLIKGASTSRSFVKANSSFRTHCLFSVLGSASFCPELFSSSSQPNWMSLPIKHQTHSSLLLQRLLWLFWPMRCLPFGLL